MAIVAPLVGPEEQIDFAPPAPLVVRFFSIHVINELFGYLT